MENNMKKITTILMLTMGLFTANVFAETAVIVNKTNATTLTQKEVSKIFLGKKKSYNDGSQVIPVALEDGNPVRAKFNSSITNKNESQLKAYWSKLVFTGKGTPPKKISTEADVVKLVAANPATIGYVDSSKVDDSVKVLFTF
jgi:ABC-type phosphate transport system substrate-binding protein